MKRFVALVVLTAIVTAIGLAWGRRAAGADEPAPMDYYPLKVGNKWACKLEEGTNTSKVNVQITRTEKKGDLEMVVVEANRDGKVLSEHLASNSKGVFRYKIGGMELPTPVCVIQYPVKKGDAWESSTPAGGEGVSYSFKSKTGDVEELKVPAGTYKAVKVETDGQVGPQKMRITTWFAPYVGPVKQLVEIMGKTTKLELEKFEEGK
jgi:hypothetical protein